MAEGKRAGNCNRQWKHQLIKCAYKFAGVTLKECYGQCLWTSCLECTWEDNLEGARAEHT